MERAYAETRSDYPKVRQLDMWGRLKKAFSMSALRKWFHPDHRTSPLREQLDHAIDSHHDVADKLVAEVQQGRSNVTRHLQIANEALRVSEEVRRSQEQ